MYPSHSSPSASSSSWSEQEQRGVSSTDTTAIDIDVDLLALLTTCIHPRFHLPSYHTISQHPTLDLEHSPLNNDLPVINQPRSKAEKQKDKKKRRKERERLRVDQGSDPRLCSYHPTGMDMVEFKLFSNVRDISLNKPLEEYPVPINPRHIPLSPSTINRKRRIIQSSVYNPSNAPLEYTHQPSSSSITYRLESPIHSVPSHRQTSSFPSLAFISTSSYPIPTWIPNLHCLPSMSNESHPRLARRHSNEDESKSCERIKPSRRKQSRALEKQVMPRYWTPPQGMGGKSLGYGWGYPSNITMRKGLTY
ncbi:hypothetical protein M231_06759 [Tremella mesenterica]|uniref:Uncharacterized protein n=1 Tax=Tremella mesenterica TaxID=5217 RepID=A0A4V1M385_TREME|nr:hypothetical protein M231_06759 [Tremella mesenterica]